MTGLNTFGFLFNPFEHDEASSDPSLNRYMVDMDAFNDVYADQPVFLFAPPGGGKTALRIHTYRACWAGGGSFHSFPIHYYLPDFFENGHFSTLDDHLSQIIKSGARSIFLGLAYYPYNFLRLDTAEQKQIVDFVTTWYPEIEHHVEILSDTLAPDEIADRLNLAFKLYQSPEQSMIRLFCEKWAELRGDRVLVSLSISRVFNHLVEIVLNILNHSAVFILLDGVDAYPQLYRSPSYAAQSLQSVLAQSHAWAKQKIFLKGFFPQDMKSALAEKMEPQWHSITIVDMHWDVSRLVEMAQRRIEVATGGKFNSLDAVATQSASFDENIERQLAQQIVPLPREMLVMIRRVITEVDMRLHMGESENQQIEIQDIQQAFAWYQRQQPEFRPITAV